MISPVCPGASPFPFTLSHNRPMAHRFTVGVEEEFQIVDPQTWELRSHVSELLASSSAALGEQIKRELHQSIVEVGTRICQNVPELREEIFRIRRELTSGAERVGLDDRLVELPFDLLH